MAETQSIDALEPAAPSLPGGVPADGSGPLDAPAAFLSACADTLAVGLSPIYAMDGGQLYGFQARAIGLDRLGFADSGALFDHAWRIGALEALKLSLVEKALIKAAEFDAERTPNLFFGIDTRLLVGPEAFFADLKALLRRFDRPAQLVTIEMLATHPDEQERVFAMRSRWLAQQGFRLALYHFGRGDSGIRTLHSCELDFVKIDPFYAQGLGGDERKRFLVERIVELAHMLGQKTILQGIEAEEDLQICRDLGADLGQGPLFCPPEAELETRKLPKRFVAQRERRRRSRSQSSTAKAIRAELVPVEPIHFRASLFDVLERFRDPEHANICPVVDDNHSPIGAILEKDLRRFIYSPYGLDLIRNRAAPVSLERFLRRYPFAKIETSPDRLMELVSDQHGEGVIITAGARYLGFLPAAALVKLSVTNRLEIAADANPLTRLPGNRAVETFLSEAIAARKVERHLCYFDFDSFKPFNDAYGFRTGDRAILLFSDILKKCFSQQTCAVCHIGGDDFFVGARDMSRDRFMAAVRQATMLFALEAESLYTAEDRERGGVMAMGRDNTMRLYPFLSCSAGVITIPAGGGAYSVDRLADDIAQVKRQSKCAPSRVASTVLDLGEMPPGAFRVIC